MTLDEFLDNPKVRNIWIDTKHYKIYVRRAVHIIDGKIEMTFDLATIEAYQPGQGNFKNFLNQLEKKVINHGFKFLYIENALEQWFGNVIQSLGYTPIDIGGINSYFKKLT